MTASLRKEFRTAWAANLARQAGLRRPEPWKKRGSDRFACFADASRFVMVAGPHEESHADLALAYGLTWAEGRRLVLVLPEDYAFPTLQRAPWLTREARPQVFTHDVRVIGPSFAGGTARAVRLPSRKATMHALSERLKAGQTLKDELREAATPAHFGKRSLDVAELIQWATNHHQLDPGHRKSERSWHCRGQRVLSIHSAGGGLVVRAGIHAGDAAEPAATVVPRGEPLTGPALRRVQAQVEEGIAARLAGAYHRPDEHWLQAVIRRDPALVGVEHPALRELPAWRPHGGKSPWGRGFVDLIGTDGRGDIRIVETKLAANLDEMFFLQGLDYYVFASAYRDVLLEWLNAPKTADLVLHYLLGASPGTTKARPSPYARAQAHALDIAWRFQEVYDWFDPPAPAGGTRTVLQPLGWAP